MRPGRTGLAVLSLFLLLAPSAAAEAITTLEPTVGQAPVKKPGEAGSVPIVVRYCYNTRPLAPATLNVALVSGVAWLTATAQPSSFRAETGSERCNAREVMVHFNLARGAPAFTPGTLAVTFTSQGMEKVESTVVLQANYWAELAVKAPRVRVARGDLATVNFEVTLGANAATRVEILGNDPQRLLSLEGYDRDFAGAGNGLDQKVTQTIPLRVTASPGAELGLRSLPVNVSTQYNRGDNQGESKSLNVEVEVVGGGGNNAPGPAAALLLAGLVVAARALRRRA